MGGKKCSQVFSIWFFLSFLQVTQLKIVSNPFAKGFRDNDTNDEWVEQCQISCPGRCVGVNDRENIMCVNVWRSHLFLEGWKNLKAPLILDRTFVIQICQTSLAQTFFFSSNRVIEFISEFFHLRVRNKHESQLDCLEALKILHHMAEDSFAMWKIIRASNYLLRLNLSRAECYRRCFHRVQGVIYWPHFLHTKILFRKSCSSPYKLEDWLRKTRGKIVRISSIRSRGESEKSSFVYFKNLLKLDSSIESEFHLIRSFNCL